MSNAQNNKNQENLNEILSNDPEYQAFCDARDEEDDEAFARYIDEIEDGKYVFGLQDRF